MSYEGSEEYICNKGHYSIRPCSYSMDDDFTPCFCGEPLVFTHSIDETNGYDEDNPATFNAPVKEIGFEVFEYTTKNGTQCREERALYAPDSLEWKEYNPKKYDWNN